MLPALTALAGVLVTAIVAVYLSHRGESERRAAREESDVWRAIDSLRNANAENHKDLSADIANLRAELAEYKGLLTGLFREVLDDPEVWKPAPRRAHDKG